ncbi:MAG: type VII secretion-associated serine protease mycosin [Sciscionella sp.]
MLRTATAGVVLLGLTGPGIAGMAPAAVAAPPPTTTAAQPPPAGQANQQSSGPHPEFDIPHALAAPLPATPPAVVPSAAPPVHVKPKPDTTYRKSTACITSGVGAVPIKQKPWAQDALQIHEAHQFATGKGETVAVIDTGVHPHPQFVDKNGYNRLHADGDYVHSNPVGPGLKDCDGHGTEVAGIIGANTGGVSGQIGFDGMAPDVDILSIRHTSANWTWQDPSKNGSPSSPITAGNLGTLAEAVEWVVDNHAIPNGHVAAINISLTACIPANAAVDGNYRKLQAAIHKAVENNIVVVAAAGNLANKQSSGCTQQNDNPDPTKLNSIPIPPWFRNDVLSVGAMNKQGDPANFSVAGPWVSVAAPGTNIISLDPAGPELVSESIEVKASSPAVDQGSSTGGGSQRQPTPLQGTSFAAPYVTGLVALVREQFPWLNARQVMHRIEATAQHPAGPSGRNDYVGYGMINPVAALTAVVPGEPGENGAPAAPMAKATQIPAALPPPARRNWTAMIVALAGTGTGVGLLLITLFVLHTIQRNKRRRTDIP